MQSFPSGRQTGGPHVPPLHWPLQHWVGELHDAPSGKQAAPPQTLLLQAPPQQVLPVMQPPPSGVHVVQFCPQIVCTSFTQMPSHALWQQKPSAAQIFATHGLQVAASAEPCTQTSCAHVTTGPQTLLLHWPLQQSPPVLHGCPSPWHELNPHTPLRQACVQQSRLFVQS